MLKPFFCYGTGEAGEISGSFDCYLGGFTGETKSYVKTKIIVLLTQTFRVHEIYQLHMMEHKRFKK